MPEVILSDYFYGDKSTQFTFFKMPRQFITNPQFKQLSTAAKLLYGMLLDRMSLSAKNGWHDEAGRVYIYYTVKEVCEAIACGRNKAMRLLAELDTNKGVGLIERKKQGQGKPDKIFVKRITTQESTEKSPDAEQGPTAPVSEANFSDVQRSENPTSRSRENRPLEVSKNDPNKTYINQTYFIQTNLSIYPQNPPQTRWMDRYEQRENLCHLISSRTSPTQNRPPGDSTQTTPPAALSKQVCRLVAQTTLVRGHSPLTTRRAEMRLTMRREPNGKYKARIESGVPPSRRGYAPGPRQSRPSVVGRAVGPAQP